MSIVCETVKDLVPLHLDGTASKMTDSLIRRHIKRCASCREYYKMCSDSKQASSARANQNTNKDDEVVYCPDDGYMLIAKRMEKTAVSSVAKDKDIARIALVGVPNEVGTSFKVFSLLAQNHINVDIILQGIGHEEGKDICFTVAEGDLKKAAELLESHKAELRFARLETNADIAKVSVVGSGMINNPGVAAKLFEALYDAHININMISTSEIKISVLVDKKDADRAVQAVHDKFFAF